VTTDDTVAVLGCGAIGLGVIAAAAYRGASVIAVDIDDGKLERARECGAGQIVNSRKQSLHETLQDLTHGHGPHVAIEAVGSPATFQAAVEEVCYCGRVVYIGYTKQPVEYLTRLFVMKELDILGSRNALPEDFAHVMRMLETASFPVQRVVTTTVSLDEAAQVMQQWCATPEHFTKIHVEC
jgi:threonine dehydrogenase-like Zn-dependent dehydrogenase